MKQGERCARDAAKAEEILKRYASAGKMMIGGWDNPWHSYDAYKTAKDMGLTHMFMWGDRGTFLPGKRAGEGSQNMEELQAWFDELGLKAVWQTGSDMNSAQAGAFDEDLRNYPCVEGIDLFDEPRYPALEMLKGVVKNFDDKFGDSLLCYFNLLPSSTPDEELHSTYAQYIDKFKEIFEVIRKGRRMVSTDVYPLLKEGDVLSLNDTWLTNMYQLRRLADETGAEFTMFIQSVGFNGHRRPKSEEEIRFQVWTDLCFGITGYIYFTYANDPNTTGDFTYTETVCNKRGEPTDKKYFEGCKRVNEEVHKFAPVYRSFVWKGVLVSYGDEGSTDAGLAALGKYALPTADFLKFYQSSSDAVYGVYRAADGSDALAVVNYTDPCLGLENTMRLIFDGADSVLMFRKGAWEYCRAAEGMFEVTLGCGEGVFLIPYRS